MQSLFLLLNLGLGAQFYLFVRHFESGGATPAVSRPPGVEGWLPIAGLMNLKYWVATGLLPDVHPAALVLLLAFAGMSWMFRKAFCSWLCPIGTISEWLWRGGQELIGRTFVAHRWVDIPLRGLKYLLLGFFAWAVLNMTPADIQGFLESPYGLIVDVKMLNFFRHLGVVGATAIVVLVAASVFVKNAWCRYLCPYGALLGLVSMASPTRIRRSHTACIDCAKCAKACPSHIPVDTLVSVRSAECTGCLECVAVCPAAGALDLTAGRKTRLSFGTVATGVVLIFVLLVSAAMLTGHWRTTLPDATYFELIPKADDFGHPGS